MKKILSFVTKNIWLIVLIAILFISTVLKVMEVKGNNFPFTTDQGRDMVDIRQMVVGFSPRLVGPTTSINGVLLGPFWYYFNLIPFIVSGGNPAIVVYWQIIWYQLSVVALWFVLRKKSPALAWFTAVLMFLMPTGFNTARYFWNANSMPFFTMLYFSAMIMTINNSNVKNYLLLGIVSGLSMQIEAAFGVLFFPFALIYFTLNQSGLSLKSIIKKLKNCAPLIFGFGLTLIPQVLFELKHGFIMTKVFLSEFTGKGAMLGEKISFSERIAQRWEHLRGLIVNSSHIDPKHIQIVFVIGLLIFIFVLVNRKIKSEEKKIWSLSFWFISFSAVFYLFFSQKLKVWYTLGLSVPLVIFQASLLSFLFENKKAIIKTIPIIIILVTIYYSIKSQSDYTTFVAFKPSDDRSNLQNELVAIDWVYQNAAGSGFKVYSYLPSVYDYPYNHLFWSYGNKKYGYEPFDIAYLPNQPEYIAGIEKIWTNKKNLDDKDLTFLIIEEDMDMPSRTVAWLGNFSKLCLIKEQIFSWHAKVQMMSTCKK